METTTQPPTAPAVGSKDLLAATLKSRNGDTLKDLNEKRSASSARMVIARQNLKVAEDALKPLREEVESAESADINICTRLNIWWRENRKKYEGG